MNFLVHSLVENSNFTQEEFVIYHLDIIKDTMFYYQLKPYLGTITFTQLFFSKASITLLFFGEKTHKQCLQGLILDILKIGHKKAQ